MKDGAAGMDPEDEIYVNLQDLCGTESCSQEQEPQDPAPEAGSGCSVAAPALSLALLCSLLLTTVITLSVLYHRDLSQLSAQLANQTAGRLQLLDRNRNLTDDLSAARRGAGRCPDGWRRFDCSCYFMSTTQSSWQSSRQLCVNLRAELVIINSQREMDFLNELGAAQTFWIGLHQSSVGAAWTWPDGSSPTVTFWQSGHPYNLYRRTQQVCAAFNMRAAGSWWISSPSWSSEACYSYLSSVCEKDVEF